MTAWAGSNGETPLITYRHYMQRDKHVSDIERAPSRGVGKETTDEASYSFPCDNRNRGGGDERLFVTMIRRMLA